MPGGCSDLHINLCVFLFVGFEDFCELLVILHFSAVSCSLTKGQEEINLCHSG